MYINKYIIYIYIYLYIYIYIYKYSCFRKCGWREKFSPRRPQGYLFLPIFQRYCLFFFSFFWFFFNSCFCLFVCLLFFEVKNVYVYSGKHLTMQGVSDKKIFTLPISGNKTTSFGLRIKQCSWWCWWRPSFTLLWQRSLRQNFIIIRNQCLF